MANVDKAIRLIKIAKEFNVGVETIVSFLNKKGLAIDLNPNNKVPPDYYDLLVREYSADLNLKKEKDKISQQKSLNKRETITLEDKKVQTQPEEELEEFDFDIGFKDKIISEIHKEQDKKTAVEKPTIQEEPKKKEPIKIIGKIDLEAVKLSEKPPSRRKPKTEKPVAKKKKETTEEQPVIIEQIVSPATEPEKEVEVIEVKIVTEAETTITPTIVEAEPTVIEPKEAEKEEILPIIETEPKKPIVEQPVAEIQETVQTEVIELIEVPIAEQKPEFEVSVTIEKIQDDHVPKIKDDHVPKIEDIPEEVPSIPVKEVVAEEVQVVQAEEVTEEVKPEIIEIKEEIFRGESERVSGPEVKVVGKIDLDSINQRTRPDRKTKKEKEQDRKDRERVRKEAQKQFMKKREAQKPERQGTQSGTGKPEAGAKGISDDKLNDRKKRKRINKEKIDISAAPKQPLPDTKKTDTSKFQPQKKKKTFKKEVTEEEVQKQIKDTLSRLTTKGKSKTSKFRRLKRDDIKHKQSIESEKIEKDKSILKITEFVTVNELASMMNIPVNKVIAACMNLGLFVSINQRLDAETLTLVSDEFGYQVEFIDVDVSEEVEEDIDLPENLKPRPPIVTVMGHVDHGKTSLLDYIRNANVIAGEAGGITQHIGAYNVHLPNGRDITFLDTPGHEAFTAMRARGAKITDIAIIVVSADDNVMPQTIEAINHAQAAGVPIIFAINKIDKPNANPEKIKEALANMNLLVEEWGGKIQSQDISAKFGKNVDLLLEKVLLETDMRELKANPSRLAKGTVIESSLDKGRGYITTILVQNGTLKNGDVVLAGSYWGHVKAMYNERGKKISESGPSVPALVLGLNGAPQAGDKFAVYDSEREAKEIANKRQQLMREQGIRTQKHITLDEIGRRLALGNFHEINVIVKGDVDGSIEALSDSIIKLSNEQIQVSVIHKAVGQISESDVMLASASNAIIIGFQVRPSLSARKIAEKEQIEIRLYSVIYDAINEMKDAMEGMLSPIVKEEITGTAEVKEVFKITKVGAVAGTVIREGKIIRTSKVRLIRDGIVVYTGDISSLKRFKDDVKEVISGYECGISINNFNDIKIGDIIESFTETEIKQKLK